MMIKKLIVFNKGESSCDISFILKLEETDCFISVYTGKKLLIKEPFSNYIKHKDYFDYLIKNKMLDKIDNIVVSKEQQYANYMF